MDKPIEKRSLPLKRYLPILALVLIAVAITVKFIATDFETKRIDRDKLRFGKVKQGEFHVEVQGNGRVMPRDIEWVVPGVTGEVAKLVVMNGDQVRKGQLLLVLRSDDLKSSFTKTKSRLAQARANLSTKIFDLNAQRTRYESDLIRSKFELEEAQSVYNAYTQLLAMPNPPISRIDYSKTAIQVKRMQAMVEVSKKVLSNFEQLENAQLAEAQARVDEIDEELAQLQDDLSQLNIAAKRDGVIQDLDLKVGQRVVEGGNIAKISDPSDVYVELKVPAYQARKLEIGQSATIELHRKNFPGVVERIDPNVKGTTVDIDIRLLSIMENARVDMFVSGLIHVQNIDDTLYVERPANSVENGKAGVYKVADDGKVAELVTVDMGDFSANHVQISHGLIAGEEIILTDLNEYDGVEKLSLF